MQRSQTSCIHEYTAARDTSIARTTYVRVFKSSQLWNSRGVQANDKHQCFIMEKLDLADVGTTAGQPQTSQYFQLETLIPRHQLLINDD